MFPRVIYDDSQVQTLIANAASRAALIGVKVGTELASIARAVVAESFIQAFPDEKAFPTPYRQHLLDAIERMPIPINKTTGEVILDFDALGTAEDLEEALHYHAKTPEGPLELPYQGQELSNPWELRYAFWQAMVDGEDFYYFPRSPISTAGLYEETVQERIAQWGDRAPEWRWLQFGIEYYPQISPHPIFENVMIQLKEVYLALWEMYTPLVDAQAAATPGFRFNIVQGRAQAAVTVPGVGNRWVRNVRVEL